MNHLNFSSATLTFSTTEELKLIFPDNATACRWFEHQRWGHQLEHLACPRCYHHHITPSQSVGIGFYRCRACRKFFSVRYGSIMHGSHLSYQKWAMALIMWLSCAKLSSMQLHRELNITQSTAWYLIQKLKHCCPKCGSLFDHNICAATRL